MRITSHNFYVFSQDDFDYIMFCSLESSAETILKYTQAYNFSTSVPMNKLYISENNNITVNGRSRPFASHRMFYKKNNFVHKWVLINPVYSINEDERIIKFDKGRWGNFSDPMPIECWKYYKSYWNKWKKK